MSTPTAQELYHDFAAKVPVLDYHCHINPQEIAEDRKFENITQVWLGGDHYKWRQMRSNGVEKMTKQMTSLANLGLLGNFIGMLTDSRSFLSYPRHEYFRRILCELIGNWVENGEYPVRIERVC